MFRQEFMYTYGVIRLESDFKQVDILTLSEVQYLKQMFDRYPKNFWTRDYNLFNLYKCDIPRRMHPNDVNTIRGISQKVKSHLDNKKDAAHYFLKYIPNSFTHVHIDNPYRIQRTAVTLIDVSQDLVGGEVVLINNISQSDLMPGEFRPDKNVKNIKVPVVVRQKVGSTLIYNHNVRHGVTKVEQGHRLVFISWYG